MRGDFDVQHSAYPFGFMRVGNFKLDTPAYRITDMRTLDAVDVRLLTVEEASEAAARINKTYRAGSGAERFETVVFDHVTDVLAGV